MRHFGIVKAFTLSVITALAACGTTPDVNVTARVDCPQPAAEALAPPQKLPSVGVIPQAPEEAVPLLALALDRDKDVHQAEVDKREVLIRHGVERCGWTR